MNKYFAIGCAWIAYGIAVASVALATHATASIAVTAIFGGLFVVVATVVLADSK